MSAAAATLDVDARVRRGSIVNETTPTASVALRNYESKVKTGGGAPTHANILVLQFANRRLQPAANSQPRPTSALLSSSLAQRYSSAPRTAALSASPLMHPLSRNSSAASSTFSILSAVPSTASTRFRASIATTSATPPISLATRYTTPINVSTARRYSSHYALRWSRLWPGVTRGIACRNQLTSAASTRLTTSAYGGYTPHSLNVISTADNTTHAANEPRSRQGRCSML